MTEESLDSDSSPRAARTAPLALEPTGKPSAHGRNVKFCPLCPGWWRTEDIVATADDGTKTSWDKVMLGVGPQQPSTRLRFRSKKASMSALTRQQRADIVGKNYAPTCPRGHQLTNSTAPTRVVGVIGNVNSSKSHYLAGLAYELIYQNRLQLLNVDISYSVASAAVMDERIDAIYRRNEVLPNTERGQVGGPFSYGMTRHAGTYRETRADLTFFDVAGEDCVDLARSADIARYMFDATGIILLLDPAGLARPGGSPVTPRGNVSLTTRSIVDNLANAIESVTGVAARDQDHIISIAIAKADSIQLESKIWPPRFWLDHTGEDIPIADVQQALSIYSGQCRDALSALGGGGIISAAETRFDKRKVYYSAVSATNQQAFDGTWCMPEPVGCSIPLAQILCFGEKDRG